MRAYQLHIRERHCQLPTANREPRQLQGETSMSIKRILTFAALALLPLAAGATTFVVPAAGTGPGANGSHWQTELTLHSSSSASMNVRLVFHDAAGAAETTAVDLAPRATVALQDVVQNKFGR